MTIESSIQEKLRAALVPSHLEIANESRKHGHGGTETHFKVVAVAEGFAGLALLERHRKIYDLLKEEMAAGVHALALHLFTPEEWEKKTRALNSPPCVGGSKVG